MCVVCCVCVLVCMLCVAVHFVCLCCVTGSLERVNHIWSCTVCKGSITSGHVQAIKG